MDQIVGQALATFQRIEASVPPRAANDATPARGGKPSTQQLAAGD
jgi:hypothetical protein